MQSTQDLSSKERSENALRTYLMGKRFKGMRFTHHQPLAEAHQPLAEAHQPLAEAHQPLAEAQMPLAEAQTPVSFGEKWDEWIPTQDRPSHQGDNENAIKAKITSELQTVFSDVDSLLARLQARYELDPTVIEHFKDAAFNCALLSAYPQQFYDEGKADVYRPGGNQYVSVLVEAGLPGEAQEPLGFILDLVFDAQWQLQEDIINKNVFENALVQSKEGDHQAKINVFKIRRANGDWSNEDYDSAMQGLSQFQIKKTPEAKLLLCGAKKLKPISCSALKSAIGDLRDTDTTTSLQNIAKFLDDSAKSAGIVAPQAQPFVGMPGMSGVCGFFATPSKKHPAASGSPPVTPSKA